MSPNQPRERLIYMAGCDDATAVVLDMTDEEFAVAQRIAAATQAASQSGCQPTLQAKTKGEPHWGWPEQDDTDA